MFFIPAVFLLVLSGMGSSRSVWAFHLGATHSETVTSRTPVASSPSSKFKFVYSITPQMNSQIKPKYPTDSFMKKQAHLDSNLKAIPNEEIFLNQTKQEFAVSYWNNGLFQVDVFYVARDGWQDLRNSYTFEATFEARTWLKERGFVQSRREELLKLFSALGLQEPQAPRTNPPLWEVKNAWNTQWEQKYSEWVHQEVDENFFIKHNISTDCADVAYVLRWIFARIHHLPAANRLSGSGQIFTNLVTRNEWLLLPTAADWQDDKRLRAALDYLLNNTYTHTLIQDSYPITVTTEAFNAGSYHVKLSGTSGHTQFIFKTKDRSYGLPFMMFSSTVPRTVRSLLVHFYWGDQPRARDKESFLRMNWALKSELTISIQPESQHPWYSLDQFRPDFFDTQGGMSFSIKLIKKLDPQFDVFRVASRIVDDIKLQITDRALVVKEGFEFCSRRSCDPTSVDYDNWSTPSRDKRIIEQILMSSNIFTLCRDCQELFESFAKDTIEVAGQSVSFKHLAYGLAAGGATSDPRNPVLQRWGLDPNAYIGQKVSGWPTILQNRLALVNSRKDSFEEDYELSESLVSMKTYFEFMELGTSETVLKHLKHFVNPLNTVPQKTLSDVARDLKFWSSTSRSEISDRWQTAAQSPFISIRGGGKITPQGWHWNVNDRTLTDLRKKDYIHIAAGFKEWTFVSNDGTQAVALSATGDTFHWLRLDSQARVVQQWTLPGVTGGRSSIIRVRFYKEHLLIETLGRAYLFYAGSSRLVLVDQIQLGDPGDQSGGEEEPISALFRDHRFNTWFLDGWNLSRGFQPLDIKKYENYSYADIFENENYALIRMGSLHLPSFLFNKKTTDLKPFLDELRYVAPGFRWALRDDDSEVNSSKFQLISFDQDLNVIDRIDFNSEIEVFENNGFIVLWKGDSKSGAATVLKLDSDFKFKTMSHLPKANSLRGFFGTKYFGVLNQVPDSDFLQASMSFVNDLGQIQVEYDLAMGVRLMNLTSDRRSMWSGQYEPLNRNGVTGQKSIFTCAPLHKQKVWFTDFVWFNSEADLRHIPLFSGAPAEKPYLDTEIRSILSGSTAYKLKNNEMFWLPPELCE